MGFMCLAPSLCLCRQYDTTVKEAAIFTRELFEMHDPVQPSDILC